MVFLNCCFFPLPRFQMTIVKNLMMDFEGSYSNFYYVTNIFDLHICNNETTAALLIFFEICNDMHFVSLFFAK